MIIMIMTSSAVTVLISKFIWGVNCKVSSLATRGHYCTEFIR